jgi:hypothetical protein
MGLFSDLFGGTKTTVTRPEPWEDQQPYLNAGFENSLDLYNSKKNTPWYGGELYAGINGIQEGGANTAWDYLNGYGGKLGETAGQASTLALGAGKDFLSNAGTMFNYFGQDPTADISRSAAAYANSPFMDGQIDAASRDVSRNLFENQLTGLNADAAGSGNVNSSRAGVAEGMMRRGAADRIGDISAGMRGAAYDKGLSTASDMWSNRASNMMGSNMQLGQLFGSGMQGLSQVGDIAASNFGLSQDAGGVFQADNQGRMDADYAKWLGNDTRAQDLLNNYWANVGTEYGAGTPDVQQSKDAGVFGKILGTVGSVMGLKS